MNRVVEIIMKRDCVSKEIATSMVEDTRDEILDALGGTSCVEVEDIIMDNLGLEPDYLDDILEV